MDWGRIRSSAKGALPVSNWKELSVTIVSSVIALALLVYFGHRELAVDELWTYVAFLSAVLLVCIARFIWLLLKCSQLNKAERLLLSFAFLLASIGFYALGTHYGGDSFSGREATASELQVKSSFQNSVVKFADAESSLHVVKGKSFENCVIKGPAVIHLAGTVKLLLNEFYGSPHIFIVMDPNESSMEGIIVVKDCEFIKCKFENIGIIGPKEQIDLLRNDQTNTYKDLF